MLPHGCQLDMGVCWTDFEIQRLRESARERERERESEVERETAWHLEGNFVTVQWISRVFGGIY